MLKSYAPIDVANAMAVLYAANRHANAPLFDWQVMSETGDKMTAVNGMEMGVDSGLLEVGRNDYVFVFGGDGAGHDATGAILTWLRKSRRLGATLVAIGGAIHTFAKAGLLNNRTASVHWMQRAAIEDSYPFVEVTSSIFTFEMGIVTCAGGAATLDMMLELVSRLHDQDMAVGIADRLVCSSARTGSHDQTVSEQRRAGVRHDKLSQALKLMQENIEDPIPPSDIAARVGISTRQLERLFSKYLKSTPKVYYTKLRLERARALLQQTNLKIIEVAIACGFSGPSHFSKVYRRHFGSSPHNERG